MMLWEIKILGDIAKIIGGGTPAKERADFYNGEIPWATVRDMRQEILTKTECYINKEAVNNSATNIILKGNVIIATRVGLGKVCLIEQDTAINQDLRGIIPIDNKKLLPKYLFWWFKSISQVILSEGTGATVQGVKIPFIKSLKIPLPPLPEQHRIVAILDEAFAGLETMRVNAERNIANVRELFNTYLANVFLNQDQSWISEKLCNHVQFVDYRGKTPPKRETGIRLITARNVKMGFIKREPEEFIDASAYDSWMTRGFPKKGDVLFTTEAPLGNIAQLDTDEKVVIGQRLITLKADTSVLDPQFLTYMLMSRPLQEAIFNRATGTTVQGIKAKWLKEITIYFPESLDKQEHIIKKLRQLSLEIKILENNYRSKIQKLDELKQSILHKAFSGKLTSSDKAT